MDNSTTSVEATVDDESSDKYLETLQDVDNTIVEITESIQAHRSTKHKLNAVCIAIY